VAGCDEEPRKLTEHYGCFGAIPESIARTFLCHWGVGKIGKCSVRVSLQACKQCGMLQEFTVVGVLVTDVWKFFFRSGKHSKRGRRT
jgi:hypothetical protein